MAGHWLAQLNVARLKAALDAPELAGFVALVEPVNALAEAAPGFVWRHRGTHGHEVGLLGDHLLLVNLSAWESLDALRTFTYGTAGAGAGSSHAQVVGRRQEWFLKMREPHQVLWWIPAGHIPTLAEAEERLRYLRAHGPGPHAFTFRSPHPASGNARQPA